MQDKDAWVVPRQLRGYYAYLVDESAYSTQQGIKGAEFERVLVILLRSLRASVVRHQLAVLSSQQDGGLWIDDL
jgi:hypothetical protein